MIKDIPKRIRELRRELTLSQSQFAELVNLSEDSVGKIERGVNTPTIDTLSKIAQRLKITMSELLGETLQKETGENKVMENAIKYLRTKSPKEVKLIHELAVKILERE